MARVLIGIPTYNRPELVREAVKSVLNQTFQDWRAIVSDNVSSGDAPERVRKWVEEIGDPRLTFFQQTEENGGEYLQGRYFFKEARNGGEEFMIILHDDDVLGPDYVKIAIDALAGRPDAAFFVSNLHIIGDDGETIEAETREFDDKWGRTGTPEGYIDVLNTHMQTGFTPISAACFRMTALEDSGFVDEDLFGCFPFESNIFLRLGERGTRAWFDSRRLFHLRRHSGQLTNLGFLNVEEIVHNTIQLFERRQFDGENERKRRQLLGRMYRVDALHRARLRDASGARRGAIAAIQYNPKSFKTWLVGGLALLCPWLVGVVVRNRFGPSTYSSC